MKSFTLLGSFALIIMMLVTTVAVINKEKDIPAPHLEVVLRDLGHRLLLSAKDSTSRVLPIKRINENKYQISFQNNFSFASDTLISLVQQEFQKNAPATHYIVNLRNCQQNETVFAFEINHQKGNLTPCRGRKLEVDCYVIEIELLRARSFNFLWLLLLIIPLGAVGFLMKDRFRKKEEQASIINEEHESIKNNDDYIQLGSFRFYPDKNVLEIEDKNITLSEKETKALKIFVENINQIVDREKLMKEIWEDNGIVVISRNVDVLVSKLRKKLSDDIAIKFTTVPGRGYKFTID